MFWVTRDYVHVDRVACPWLISRFIDRRAQFVFMPKDKIADFVEKTGAIPYDTGLGTELNHYELDGEKYCSFDAIMRKYDLGDDEALARLQKVVRAADTNRFDEEPLAWGLEAIASGTPLLVETDHEALEMEFPFYDAIYAYLQREIVLEKSKDEIAKLKTRGEKREFLRNAIAKLDSKKLK